MKKNYSFKKYLIILGCLSLGLGIFELYKNDKLRIQFRYYSTRILVMLNLIDYDALDYNKVRYENFNTAGIEENLDDIYKKLFNKFNRDDGFPLDIEYPGPRYLNFFNGIKQRIYNISMLLDKPGNPLNNAESLVISRTIKEKNWFFEIDLPQNREIINKKLVIKNIGAKPIRNPRIIINGKKNWFSVESVLGSIIKPNMSDEEKALSIWDFLNDNIYHYDPATEGGELHNIVKYLNAYGYGYCDDTAINFYILLDSDHRVFYLKQDNREIAGVEDLANDPDLIFRIAKTPWEFPSKAFVANAASEADLYHTKNNQKYFIPRLPKEHTLDFSLRPEETFIALWESDDYYVSYGIYTTYRPPKYGKGTFIYQPHSAEVFSESITKGKNVILADRNQNIILTADDSSQPASFAIKFDTPYPIIKGRFELNCSTKANDAQVGVYFSQDGTEWWEIAHINGGAGLDLSKSFTNYFPNGYSQPLYSYFLKFEFTNKHDGQFMINNFKIITETQLAPNSLPELENGRNTIAYTSESSEQAVDVELYYVLGKQFLPGLNPPHTSLPAESGNAISFSWELPDKPENNSLVHNFQLSAREDFLIPLAPNFDIITISNQISVGKEWLTGYRTYYWRVRSKYKDEPYGGFSAPQKLEITPK
ncbi:MAG: hypothetical protein HZA78_12950 [Candidatus Schekmanbacteria bacterium]|nr:hypothetical protein [Candidatus Schekmanbacteria bacterium]